MRAQPSIFLTVISVAVAVGVSLLWWRSEFRRDSLTYIGATGKTANLATHRNGIDAEWSQDSRAYEEISWGYADTHTGLNFHTISYADVDAEIARVTASNATSPGDATDSILLPQPPYPWEPPSHWRAGFGWDDVVVAPTLVGNTTPQRVRTVCVPFWPFAATAGVHPCWSLLAMFVRFRRRTKQWCVTCGYDLRASPDRCPECGAAHPC